MKGRLIVHSHGANAGQLNLKMELPPGTDSDEVLKSVRLILPGELSPLEPIETDRHRGRFELRFFSSDISNAGRLPAEAVVSWDDPNRSTLVKAVDVVAAEERATSAVPQIADAQPTAVRHGSYPRTVLVAVVASLVGATLVTLAALTAWPAG